MFSNRQENSATYLKSKNKILHIVDYRGRTLVRLANTGLELDILASSSFSSRIPISFSVVDVDSYFLDGISIARTPRNPSKADRRAFVRTTKTIPRVRQSATQ